MVRDPDVKHQLARLNRQAWSVYRRLGKRKARNDESARKIIAAVQWQADHFEEIPVVVVACLHGRSPVFGPPVMATSFYGSAYPAVQNLLLAARGLGLGATLTTLPLWSTALARRTLGLPAEGHPGGGDPPRLAPRAVRSDHPETGGRSGTSRPLRESVLPVSCCSPRTAPATAPAAAECRSTRGPRAPPRRLFAASARCKR